MRFDENAPGGGVEAVCTLENGKAFLEWKLYFAKDLAEPGRSGAERGGDQEEAESGEYREEPEIEGDWEEAEGGEYREEPENGRSLVAMGTDLDGKSAEREHRREINREASGTRIGYQIRIQVMDGEGNSVLECRQQLREEEPLQSILLQPRLWRGVEEPYLYDMEAILMDGYGRRRDRVRGHLPLRSLSNRQSGSLALNGAAWEPRAVRYFLPDKGSAADSCRQMEKDLRMLLELGANCVCLEGLDEGLDSLGEGLDSLGEGRDSWNEGLDGLDDSRNGKTWLYRFFLRLCERLGFLAFGKRKTGSEYVWIQEADLGARMMRREAVILACGGEAPVLRSRKDDIAICRKEDNTVIYGKDDTLSRRREAGNLPGERGSVSMGNRAEKTHFPGDGEETDGSEEGAIGSRRQVEALLPDGEHPGPCFYRCLAEWSRRPFVHIVPESVRKMKSGNYTALCYSNCDKVALYSDGILFGFRSGEKEFCFQEIPAKSPCIMLAAEGDGCSEALSVHKSFVKQWENEGIWH